VQLSDQYISEFRRLWQAEFNENLSEDEARREAGRFLEVFALLAGPIRSESDQKQI